MRLWPRRAKRNAKPPEGERRRRWWRDRHTIGNLAVIACVGASAYTYYHESHQRLADLRDGCHRTSQRTAADVNLNWLYYQSEVELVGGSDAKLPINSLSPGERGFLQALANAGKPSQLVLKARAAADYNAAYVKAQQVDRSDAHLIDVRTRLGYDPTPRRWVIKAGFSCDQAYK